MTQKAAICLALLRGDVLTIMNGFKLFYCSNIPREISRSVEKPFGVSVSRTRKDFISTYGQPGFYFEYRLNKTEFNKDGIEKMKAYCKEEVGKELPAKTHAEVVKFRQLEMVLK